MRYLVTTLSLLSLGLAQQMPDPELPDVLSGFAGELSGQVIAIYDQGFSLEVADVASVWRHSDASDPQAAVGRTLLINLRWEKDDQGGWRMVPRQLRWLRLLRAGDPVRVDLANREGARLHLMELNQEQREAVERGHIERGDEHAREEQEREEHAREEHEREERDQPREARDRQELSELPEAELPEALRGFSGMLHGEVVRIGELGFVLAVDDVRKIWRGNQASDPQAAVGRELLINVQWTEGDGGRWHPVEQHLRWLRSLRSGDEVSIEVRNDEAQRLHILELSKEQRRARD